MSFKGIVRLDFLVLGVVKIILLVLGLSVSISFGATKAKLRITDNCFFFPVNIGPLQT